MKRQLDYRKDAGRKKIKSSPLGNVAPVWTLPDEMCTVIMSYLDQGQVLRRCILVSKQWLRACAHLGFSLNTSSWPSCGPVTLKKRLDCSFTSCFTGLMLEGRLSLKNDIKLIGECSNMSRLTHLTIKKCGITNGSFSELLASPHISNITYLDLTNNKLVSRDPKPVGLSNMQNLTELYLRENSLGKEMVEDFVNSFPKLTLLDLENCYVQPEAVGCIANSSSMSSVKYLNLNYNHVLNGAIDLANSPYLTKLTHLKLNWCEIPVSAIKALCESGKLKNIKVLDIGRNDLGPEGAEYLANCEDLSYNLTNLNISDNLLNEEGAVSIFKSPFLNKLKHLFIDKNRIGFNSGHAGFDAIIACEWLKNLFSLSLAENTISFYGEKILDCEGFCNVRYLNLGSTRIKGNGVKKITTSKTFSNLKTLNISRNAVLRDDSCATDFANSSTLVNLTHLDVYNTKITDAGELLIKGNVNLPQSLIVEGARVTIRKESPTEDSVSQ